MRSIGANVTKVPAYLFYPYSSRSYAPNIIRVIFEEDSKCTSIGDSAFRYCTSLTTITIPDSVTSVGDDAFYNCTSLTSVYYGGTVSQWASISFGGNEANPLYYADNLYLNGTLLATDITLENITSISAYAFYNCTSLESVTIGDGVTTIGSYAFYNCTSLTSVSIGNRVTSIDGEAFRNCTSLTSITIPDSVTFIGSAAFGGCSGLVCITLPFVGGSADATEASASTLFGYIFGTSSYTGFTSIRQDYASGSYTTYSIPTMLTTVIITGGNILYGAFSGCTALTSITIPDSVTSIGSSAFSGCTSLSSISIGGGVETIGGSAFSGCTSLSSISIGSGVETIGSNAFYNCTALTEVNFNATAMNDLSSNNYVFYKAGQNGDGITVNIGKNVTRIPNYLFNPYSSSSYSPNIISVVFEEDSKCTSVGSSAFYNCTSLTSVYYNGTTSQWASISFDNYSANPLYYAGNLYIKDESGETGYSLAVDITIEEITSINAYAFYGCTSIESITIGDSVTTISDDAFNNCTTLESVSIGNGVETIGRSAFCNCTSLTSITIPESVTSISNYAFYNCAALTKINFNATAMEDLSSSNYVFCNAGQDGEGMTVNIGKNVTRIPDYLFYHYASYALKITSVLFEADSKCTSIGESAFRNCKSLTSITIPNSVITIGNYAFYNCTALTEINFNATAMEDLSSSNYVFYCAGQDGEGMTVNIDANVTKIPAYLFDPYYRTGYDYSPKITSVLFEADNKCTSIGRSAFCNCTSLTSITIPDSVTSIGDGAFYYCTMLESVTIGSGVENIGSSAFYNCTSLTSITIPDSVTSIGDSAFRYCYKLLEVYNLSSSLKITVGSTNNGYVGYYALYVYTSESSESNFVIQGDYIFINDSGTYYLIKYVGNDTAITLPALTVNGETVTYSIYQYAFYNNSIIISVTIPNSVTTIGGHAFYDCTSLESVIISGGVKTIEESAFYGCTSLTSVTMSDSVTSIGSSAFYGCTSLTSVTMSDSVTSIGSSAFYGCTSLTSVTIPNSVTSIGSSAFYNCISLESMIIDGGVKTIGSFAFYGCTALTRVTIPDSVTSIGSGAFRYCTSLISITVESGNTYYKSVDGNLYSYDGAELIQYAIGKSDTSFEVPEDVTTIDSYAFYYSTSLESVTISDSVTSIGLYAFYYSTSLESVTISDSVISIGSSAFYYCSSLTSVYYSGTASKWASISFGNSYANPLYNAGDLYLNGVLATDITIEGISVINSYAFYDCTSITSITIGDSVTSIGSYAFYRCTSLERILIGSSVGTIGSFAFYNCISLESIIIGDGVKNIDESAFSGCIALTSVTIPDSVTSIGNYSFYGCTLLTSVTIGDSVTSIGSSAFSGCTVLTSVVIPDSVTFIGNSAFGYCTSLTSITVDSGNTYYKSVDGNLYSYDGTELIQYATGKSDTSFEVPEDVKTIGSYAFYYSTSLESITIGSNVTTIGSDAFYYSTSLKNVYYNGTASQWASISFGGSSANPLYYADKLYLKGELATDITIEGIESINAYAFYGCTSITSITIGDSVTSIGNYAFRGCTSLTSVIIGDSVISIGDYVFRGCTSLTSVTIGSNLTSIGSYAFYGCTSLESITIGSSVTSIGSYAFYGCTSLESITIGSNVASIGSYAFYGCSSLANIMFENTIGWYRTTTAGATSGTGVDVTDVSVNVTYFIDTYYNYYWYRSE